MAIKIEQPLELWNIVYEKEIRARKRKPVRVVAKVDNGSSFTVLPAALAKQLDLWPGGWVRVRYADERRARKRIKLGLRIRIAEFPGRLITTDVLAEPKRTTVLLGCEELERMELVADHKAGVLRPRPGTEKGITAVVD